MSVPNQSQVAQKKTTLEINVLQKFTPHALLDIYMVVVLGYG